MKLTSEVKRTDLYRLKNSAYFRRFLVQYKMKFVNFVPKTILGSKNTFECRLKSSNGFGCPRKLSAIRQRPALALSSILSNPVITDTIAYLVRRLDAKTARCQDFEIKSSFLTKRRQTQTESMKQSVCRIVGPAGSKMGKIKVFGQSLDLVSIRKQR